ncbi:MAG: proline dehydrogenase family protein [Longimicrobiales bacterium]|nr:proline dehydrogenase family protein [Longimicrobiales bacterium]
MIKTTLLWASTNPFMARRFPRYGFVRRAVRRFMPGEVMEDALREADALLKVEIPSLVTELGENVETLEDARRVVEEYLELARTIEARGLDTELSVKPTHLGLDLGLDATVAHLVEIARAAPGIVWVDMEASGYVDATLELFRRARAEVENLGICLQAYLHRTPDDYESLLTLVPHIRLVKGAYLEPPEVAISAKRDVDAAFGRIASRMLQDAAAGRMGRACLGTHDPHRIADARRIAGELGLAPDRWEVAMLYGIAGPEQLRLARGGVRVRVLISYGTHWWPWYVRRLAERPANLAFVVRQLVRR